jgi:glycosyltransferase involved in cell wall biosynthesis
VSAEAAPVSATIEAPWDVVTFGSVDFNANWQRPQAIAAALAERGASVLYVNNLGVRLPGVRDARRLSRRLRGIVNGHAGVGPGLSVATPIVLPFQHVQPVRALGRATLLRRIARRREHRPLVVWTYLPLPAIRDVAETLEADLLVYDWADDASARVLTRRPSLRRRLAAWEDEMVAAAGVVFVASRELLRHRGSSNPRTYVVPHGVSAGHDRDLPVPPPVATLPRPRIGFVGSISEWVDLELLDGLTRARPDWSFVMVGPRSVSMRRIAHRPNVVVVDEQPHDEIPAFLEAFDAALIPYRPADATSAASPVKLREYLAHGLPVVSSDIPEVRPFARDVEVAEGVDGFVGALDRALARGKRSAPMQQRTWSQAVDEMVGHVETVLAGSRR